MNKYAYVTLATSERYFKGVEFLYYSLKKVNSQYPLIVMVPEELLKTIKSNIKVIYKTIPHNSFDNKNKKNRYKDTINKFQIFNLIEYEKLIFLDADVFLFENIDYIFSEYNQYEFLAYIYPAGHSNQDLLPRGDIMLITPKAGVFDNLLNKILTNKYTNDEQVIKYLLYPDYFITEQYAEVNTFQNVNLLINKKYFHCYGHIKYFDILEYPENFIKLPMDFIKNYFLIFNYYKNLYMSRIIFASFQCRLKEYYENNS